MTTPDQTTPESTPPPVGARPTPLAVASIASFVTAAGLGGIQLFAPDIAEQVPDALGTVSSWISAGGIVGILSLMIWWQLGNRKIRVDQERVDVERDQQHNVDKADIRDHYALEVGALRDRIDAQAARHATTVAQLEARYQSNVSAVEDRYEKALASAEKRHEDCEAAREELAGKVRKLEDDIAGLNRQLLANSADRVIVMEERGVPTSSLGSGAARRVKDQLDNGAAQPEAREDKQSKP
jgi:hypothetical protein